jgi:hypothetical protein
MGFLLLAFWFSLATASPPGPDCEKAQQLYQQQISGLNRSCARKADCRLDVLDWTACGYPVSHHDPDTAQTLVQARASLHAACHYIVAPCANQIAEAFCRSGTCTTGEELLKRNSLIRFKFTLAGRPLSEQKIIIDYDNGIRCETAPCPSRTLLAAPITDLRGELTLPLEQFLKIKRDRRFRLNHSDRHHSEFSLDEVLSGKEGPVQNEIRHETRWEK